MAYSETHFKLFTSNRHALYGPKYTERKTVESSVKNLKQTAVCSSSEWEALLKFVKLLKNHDYKLTYGLYTKFTFC